MAATRVLVVDDSLHTRRTLRSLLEGAEYLVQEAADSSEALKSIERDRPDAIILDVMLPGRSGLELSADLKSAEKYRNIPILIFTGVAQKTKDEADRWKGKMLADDFLTKPAKGREVLEKIRRLLVRKTSAARR